MPKIAISYRRADTAAIAGRIFDRLTLQFGIGSVFMDIDLPIGKDFRKQIRDALHQSDVLIVVIGTKWRGPKRRGRFRINDLTDPVRIEVETAFAENIPIIPVLVDDAKMPDPAELPDSLKEFAYVNAAEMDVGRDFNQHMERLIRSIDRLIADKIAPPASVQMQTATASPAAHSEASDLQPRAAVEAAALRGFETAEDLAPKGDAPDMPRQTDLDRAEADDPEAEATAVATPVERDKLDKTVDPDTPASGTSSEVRVSGTECASEREPEVLVDHISAAAIPNATIAEDVASIGEPAAQVATATSDPKIELLAPALLDPTVKTDDEPDTGGTATNRAHPRTRKLFILAAAAASALVAVFFLALPKITVLTGLNLSTTPAVTTQDEPPASTGQSQPPAAANDQTTNNARDGGDGQKLTSTADKPTVPLSPRVQVCAANRAEPDATPGMGGPLATVAIKPILTDAKELRTVAFSPDAQMVAIAGDDGKVRLFNASTYTLLRTVPGHEEPVYSIAFSPDGSKLASASWDGTVRVWDVLSGAQTNRFDAKAQKQGQENKQYAVTFATDRAGKYLLSGGADGTIWIWNLTRNDLDRARTGHNDSHHATTVRSLSFAPNGSDEFVSAGSDGTIRFYLPKGGTKKVDAHKRTAFRAIFSPSGDRVLSAGYDGKLKIWQTKGQELLKTYDASSKYLLTASWSLDGKKLASSGGDRTIRLWDAEGSGTQLLRTFEEQHKEDVEAVVFDPLRNRLLSVSEDKTLKVWNVETGKPLLTVVGFENGDYLAFDPNGCYTGSTDVERHFKITVEGFAKDQEIDPDTRKALLLQNGFGELTR